jgi:hypothetical protein
LDLILADGCFLIKTQPFNFRFLINKCGVKFIRSHERILQPSIAICQPSKSHTMYEKAYGPNFFLLKNLEINLMSDKLLKLFKDDLINS